MAQDTVHWLSQAFRHRSFVSIITMPLHLCQTVGTVIMLHRNFPTSHLHFLKCITCCWNLISTDPLISTLSQTAFSKVKLRRKNMHLKEHDSITLSNTYCCSRKSNNRLFKSNLPGVFFTCSCDGTAAAAVGGAAVGTGGVVVGLGHPLWYHGPVRQKPLGDDVQHE